MTNKNILITIQSLKAWWWAEKTASELWNNLLKDWYNTSVFTFAFFENLKKNKFNWKEFSINEKSLQSNIITKIYRFFSRAYKIKKVCDKNNINTNISIMEYANFSSIISKILFRNKAKTIINICHSISDYNIWFVLLIKILYRFADKIVVLTKAEKDNLINNFGIKEDKIEIIYRFSDLEKVKKSKEEKLKEKYEKILKNWKFTFINIGRLHKVKNQELLIKTFKKFNKKYPNTQLVILGEGNERKNLEKIINNNSDIYLLWRQSNVYNFLNNSDCFVLSSRSEAFWNVIVEAIEINLPIISTKTQGGLELLWKNNEYGLILKDNTEEELFETMEKIYLDENLKNKYKEKNKERIKDFDINTIMGQWKKIL